MKFKHIVFDIDGTLIDTEYTVLYSLKDTLKTVLEKEYKVEDLTFSLGIPGEAALKQLGVKDIKAANELWNKNWGKYQNKVKLFNNIEFVLDELSNNKYNLGIVTSQTEKEMQEDFRKLGLEKYFKTIINANSTINHKPSKDPMLKYIELSNAKKETIIYIGDSEYDMLCAKNAGVDFALAVWGAQPNNNIEAEYYLKDPKDLLMIL